MSESSITFVGLDVHKDSVDIAIADAGCDGEVRHVGPIGGDLAAMDKALRRRHDTSPEQRSIHQLISPSKTCVRRCITQVRPVAGKLD